METSLLLAALVATAFAALAQFRASRELRVLRARVLRITEWLRERVRSESQAEDLRQLQLTTEATVATGTAVVQAVHRGVASIPFGILEAIPVTRDTTRIVRKVHDRISGLVYSTIAGGNRVIGGAVRHKLEGEGKPAAKPAIDEEES